MSDSARTLTDLFGFRGSRRASHGWPAAVPSSSADEVSHTTRSLQKFVTSLQSRENPVLLDLGPVVGSNLSFFGEQLGCRIRVEDLATDLDSHFQKDAVDQLPAFLTKRFPQPRASVDGILCWDLFDYLDKPAAEVLATAMAGLLKPDGALLGFFNTIEARQPVYTKYMVVDAGHLRYRTYPAARARQRALLTGDIIRLFKDLRVSESFLMKSHVREMLFRKNAA
jgi:hypothetical protein